MEAEIALNEIPSSIAGDLTSDLNKSKRSNANVESFATLYGFMGFCGITCLLKPFASEPNDLESAERQPTEANSSKSPKAQQRILKIVASFVICLSMMYSLLVIKLHYVNRLVSSFSKLKSIALFGRVNQLFLHLKLLLKVWEKRPPTLTFGTQSSSTHTRNVSRLNLNISSVVLIISIGSTSFLLSTFAYELTHGIEWSLTEMIEGYGSDMSYSALKWNVLNESKEIYKVDVMREGKLQATTVILGLFSWTMDFFNVVVDMFSLVLFLLTTKSLYGYLQRVQLMTEGSETGCDVAPQVQSYKLVAQESRNMNQIVGRILQNIHLQFVILVTQVLQQLGWGDTARVDFISPLTLIALTLVGYTYAVACSRQVRLIRFTATNMLSIEYI